MSIITVDSEKCVGCNSCVRVCPAHEANMVTKNSDGDMIITINDDKCIKCGECIKICTHQARSYADDTDAFWKDLKSGVNISLIVAPAIKVAFDGYWRHVLKWLKNNGIKSIYDVSFGADICTWAHLELFNRGMAKNVISQPCAAITNYILKYKPSLLTYLSPVHSPMLCTASYMNNYMGISGKIAALSPCIAKKCEFEQTGLVDYNVTFERLKQKFEENNIKFPTRQNPGNNKNNENYCDFEFDVEQGLEGSFYPRPGGLKDNLLIHNQKLNIINSEGVGRVYSDLCTYDCEKAENLPDVFDVLSCEFGCNSGPAVGKKYSLFAMDNVMQGVKKFTKSKRTKQNKLGIDKQFAYFSKKLKLDDFCRTYTADNINIKVPTEAEINKALISMNKNTYAEQNFDCHACGFISCKDMASAICKGINVHENCMQYSKGIAEQNTAEVAQLNEEVMQLTNQLQQVTEILFNNISNVNSESENIDKLNDKCIHDMDIISDSISKLNQLSNNIVEAMSNINIGINSYTIMTNNVNTIARQINLCALPVKPDTTEC